jgi:hypothetical protein
MALQKTRNRSRQVRIRGLVRPEPNLKHLAYALVRLAKDLERGQRHDSAA